MLAYKHAIDQQRAAAPDEFAAQAQELGMGYRGESLHRRLQRLNLDVEWVCAAMRQQRASLRNPTKTVREYLATLESQGLSGFSQAVRHYAVEL